MTIYEQIMLVDIFLWKNIPYSSLLHNLIDKQMTHMNLFF